MKKVILPIFLIILFTTGKPMAMGEGKMRLSWEVYKSKYLKEYSYIVDPYNNNRVTSESQGYGLLIAIINNDKKTFDSIYNWSKKNIQRTDYLFSWHWEGTVRDKNNASDGDLIIAYSLLKAYQKWKDEYYLREFEMLNRSLKRLIVNVVIGRDIYALFLPAIYGFSNEKYEITIYPSYYIEFILKDLSRIDKDWEGVYRTIKSIYNQKNLTTTIRFSLVEKTFFRNRYADLDVFRVILYSYNSKETLESLKLSFVEIDSFFRRNGYIPLSYDYELKEQDKMESPFCVYYFFYILYKDERYLEKYNKLLEIDKNNYFCDSLMLILEGIKNGL